MSQRAPPPQPYNLQPRITHHLSPSMPTDDSFIDPALRALPTSASASRQTAGTKRRARGEATTKSPTTASTSRVTRRSAAAAAAPSQNDLAEPSRGEEENLIGYGSSVSVEAENSYKPCFCTRRRSLLLSVPAGFIADKLPLEAYKAQLVNTRADYK